MAANAELLAEAKRRGILPADKAALYDEAVRRGLIESPPAAVQAGANLRDIPRQFGLAARYGLEGAGDVAGIVGNPIAAFGNKATEALGLGTPFSTIGTSGLATQAADAIGLPSPEGANERVVADASRLLVGAGTMAGGANAVAKGATGAGNALLTTLAANPGSQAASAVGAGLAGGSVREAGGGPWEQFAASLLGGVVSPLALSATQAGVRQAESFLRQKMQPNEIEGQVKVVFERAGVNWGELSEGARRSLIEDAKGAVYSGQSLDDAALRRLADYRNVGATPLTGDITQDPGLITRQRNLAKTQANMAVTPGADLSQVQNQNAKTVLSTLDDAASSPKDAYATGQAVIDRVKTVDDAISSAKNAAYDTARDAVGQEIPLTPATFINKAWDELDRQLKGKYLPAEIRDTLAGIAKGEMPFDVRTIDILKTDLSRAMRKAANDGSAKAALSIVRDALESTEPKLGQFGGSQVVTGQAGDAMAAASKLPPEALRLLDKARKLSASQFKWRESAPFIEDALSGADPDKFVQKHIINGSVADLAKLRKLAGGDPILRDAVRAQLVGYIKARGGADTDVTKFSSAGLEKGLEALGDRKLTMWFTPQELSKLKSAVNVAKYMQSQPIGSAVNNSNTGAMVVGKVLDLIVSKSKLLPLGESLVSGPITNIRAGIDARQLQNVGDALAIPQPRQPLPAGALALGAAVPPGNQDRRN